MYDYYNINVPFRILVYNMKSWTFSCILWVWNDSLDWCSTKMRIACNHVLKNCLLHAIIWKKCFQVQTLVGLPQPWAIYYLCCVIINYTVFVVNLLSFIVSSSHSFTDYYSTVLVILIVPLGTIVSVFNY